MFDNNPTCCHISTELNHHYGFSTWPAQKSIKILKSELQVALRNRFIVYSIQFDNQVVSRRYSEFDGLRTILVRLYPTVIIPILPDKHSLFQYIYTKDKGLLEKKIIESRIRCLEIFLNRIALDNVLRYEHIFHRFLKNGDSWDEILHSTTVSNLPSNPIFFSPSQILCLTTPLDTPSERIPIAAVNDVVKSAPAPSFLSKINRPQIEWENRVIASNKFLKTWKEKIELDSKKIAIKLKNLNESYSELGAILNAFSLITDSEISHSIEHTGQTIDSVVLSQNSTQNSFSVHVLDPICEYSKFAAAKVNVLRFRDLKQIQLELTQTALDKAKTNLNNLINVDNEFNRLSNALATDDIDTDNSSTTVENIDQPEISDISQPTLDSVENPDNTNNGTNSDNVSDDGKSFLRDINSLNENDNFIDTSFFISTNSSNLGTGIILPSYGNEDPDNDSNYTDVSESESDDPLYEYQRDQFDFDNGVEIPSAIPNIFRDRRKKRIPTPKKTTPHVSNVLPPQNWLTLPADTAIENTDQTGTISRAKAIATENTNPSRTTPIPTAQVENLTPNKRNKVALRNSIMVSPKMIASNIFNQISFALYKAVDIDPGQQRKLEITKLTKKISELEELDLILCKDIDIISENTLSSINHYSTNMKSDFYLLFTHLANLEISLNKKSADFWRSNKTLIHSSN